jgi:hypothetical protein
MPNYRINNLNNFMFRILLICCVVLLAQLHSLSHAQTAYLRSNQIFVGDIAELTIEYDDKIPSLYELDMSVLEADFEVLDINSGIARIYESDKAFYRMRWEIEILPRRTGNLRIPALQVGDNYTPVLKLEVAPQSAELSSTSNVYVELQAEPENPYVKQQIQIVIRVIHNTPLFDGELLDPEVENADTYRVGADSIYSIFLNGNEFQVLERKLSIIARSPGKIRIPPASFRGLIKSDGSTSATGLLTQSRRINRNSEAVHLQVRTPPSGFSGNNWLPAKQLDLEQHWGEIIGELHVGDSVGLTLSIEAKGLAAEALPAGLLFIDSDKIKIYADQETRSNRFDDRELIGRLDQRFAVIVRQPGVIEIPKTLLKWWDIEQEAEKVAILEGRKWTVSRSSIVQRDGDNTEISQAWIRSQSKGFNIAAMRKNWHWWTLTVVALVIICLLFCVRRLRNRIHEKLEVILISHSNRKMLKQACVSNDPSSTCRELIKWGRVRWPDDNVTGLLQLKTRAKSSELAEELSMLDAALYADHGFDWQGGRLWQLIAAEHRLLSYRPSAHESSLPDLYPQRA